MKIEDTTKPISTFLLNLTAAGTGPNGAAAEYEAKATDGPTASAPVSGATSG